MGLAASLVAATNDQQSADAQRNADQRHISFRASSRLRAFAPSLSRRAVDHLPDQIHVAAVARDLLDHVRQDPADAQ